MKTPLRICFFISVACSLFYQFGKPHPDYLLGLFYGLVASWIVPGMAVAGLAHLLNLGEIGAPGMLAVSAAFWLLMAQIAKRPRRTTAVAPPVAVGPQIFSRSRTRTYTVEED